MSLKYRPETTHLKGSGTVATVAVLAASAVGAFQFIHIFMMIFTVSAAGVVTMQDTAGNALSQPFQLGANSGLTIDIPFTTEPWFSTRDNTSPPTPGVGLQFLQGTSANTIAWDIWYLATP